MTSPARRPVSAPRSLPGLAGTLFLLGLASIAFDFGCVFIKTPFLRAGITAGDFLEVVGVFVVAALFARVGRLAGASGATAAGVAAAATAFALGHGLHVAANSIHDLLARSGVGDPTGLVDFWDEHASHHLIDAARALFAVAVTGATARGEESPPNVAPSGRLLPILGGTLYGLTTFASAVEGQTVPMMLSFSLLYVAWSAIRYRSRVTFGPGWPVSLFFTVAFGVALVLFAVWGVWHGDFPEFTKTGWLRPAS